MAEENTGMSRGRKILVGFIVVLFLLTIGAYFFGVYYFTEHFLPGTQVNGFNCSYMMQEFSMCSADGISAARFEDPAASLAGSFRGYGLCRRSAEARCWSAGILLLGRDSKNHRAGG